MYEKFEGKYLKTSEVILSLYNKTTQHASSCPKTNIMSIKAQLNSTYITVFIISIYVTHVKLYGLDDQGFNPLAGVQNLYYSYRAQRKHIGISIEDFRLLFDVTSLSDCMVLNGKMMMNSELEGCGSVKWPKLRNCSSA